MNIFDTDKLSKDKEVVDIIKQNENVKIEKIISFGQTTDWMIQDKEEFVLLIQGKAIIEYEDKSVELKAGDILVIKKNERHRVLYTSKNPCCIWLCVFY